MDFSGRKRIRLEDFDYSRNGAYFITLCTQNRMKVLSEIVPVGDGFPVPSNTVIAWFKYQTTKEINRYRNTAGRRFWQRSFFDHVVRNKQDFEDIWYYIDTNPQRWIEKYSGK